MPKAFLSHSSVQKEFVQKIATDLKTFAIIDSIAFEQGLKNIDEIIQHINNSDLFVIFISATALDSEWVANELSMQSSGWIAIN